MIITTLPISPLLSRPFLSLSTVICADTLARFTNALYYPSLNMTGIRNFDSPEVEILSNYKKLLTKLGISLKEMFLDTEEEYRLFFTRKCCEWMKNGRLAKNKDRISWCPCGIVEISTEHLLLLKPKQLKLISQHGDWFKCKKCKKELYTESKSVWKFSFSEIVPRISMLGVGIKQLGENLHNLSSNNRIVSRQGNKSVLIEVNSELINFDPDFYWSLFLNYLLEKQCKEITVAVGVRTTQQLAQCISHLPQNSNSKVTCVIHPYKSLPKNKGPYECTIKNFMENEEDSRVIRTILSLGLSWNAVESKVENGDLYLVRKSVRPKDGHFKHTGLPPMDSSDFILGINTINLKRILKRIRGKQQLNEYEKLCCNSIFGPAN